MIDREKTTYKGVEGVARHDLPTRNVKRQELMVQLRELNALRDDPHHGVLAHYMICDVLDRLEAEEAA